MGLSPPDSFWHSLIDKIHSKLEGWKGSLLSQAGKVVVLKSVLQSTLLYALSLFKIRKFFSLAIEKIQKYFLWTGTENKKNSILFLRKMFACHIRRNVLAYAEFLP